MHSLEIGDKCEKEIRTLTRKNKALEDALKRAIERILAAPEHFKPMRWPLQNTRRVHVFGSFVLVYEVKGNAVRLLRFAHHDDAYK